MVKYIKKYAWGGILIALTACIGIRNEFDTIRFQALLTTEVPIELVAVSAGDTIPPDTVISIIQPMVSQGIPLLIDTLNLSSEDIDRISPDEITLDMTTSNENFDFLREVQVFLSSPNDAEEVLVAFLDTIPLNRSRSLTLIREPINARGILLTDNLVSLRTVMNIREEIDKDLLTELNIVFEVTGEQD